MGGGTAGRPSPVAQVMWTAGLLVESPLRQCQHVGFHVLDAAAVERGVEEHAGEVAVDGGLRLGPVGVGAPAGFRVAVGVGQRADLRVLFQAHRKDLAVHPLLHGGVAQAAGLVAGMVFTVGGDQCPARFAVGLAGEVDGRGGAGQVGREERGALAGLQVHHEDITPVGLVVDGHVNIFTLLVQRQIRVFGLLVQLHVGLAGC